MTTTPDELLEKYQKHLFTNREDAQQRKLLEAMQAIRSLAKVTNHNDAKEMFKTIGEIWHAANAAIIAGMVP